MASAPVTLTGTNTFNYNWANGLQIDSIGAITISNLNANNNGRANTNGGAGAQLNNCENYGIPQCSTSVVHAVTLTGNNIFDNNYYDGLDITAYGPIVASNITADDNGTSASDVNAIYYTGGSGASWDNCVWSNSTNSCTGSSTVTLTGINQFNGNYSDLISTDPNNLYNFPQGGLTITSGGAITVNNVTANGDLGGDGAYIYNNITATAQAITVNNTLSNTFNGNAVNGLEVDSIGVINVSNITANTNGKDGAYLDNCIQYNSGQCSVAAAQSVTVTNTTLNTFNGNAGDGLDVESYGSITASNLNASGNGTSSTSGTGVLLNNDYAIINASNKTVNSVGIVTLTGVNQFNSNWDDGLDIRSYGAITLYSITANGNGTAKVDPTANFPEGYGVYIQNNYNTALPQAVSILGTTNQFNNNWLSGLDVFSYGTITLNSATATSNGQGKYGGYGFGASLNNCLYNGSACAAVTAMPVTVIGSNVFNGNYDSGLWVSSKGAITVSNITADNNRSGNGAYLENDYTGATPVLTLIGALQFNGNGDNGLEVYTKSAITLTDVDAIGNTGDGAYLNNTAGTVAAAVTLANTNVFSENGNNGLEVHTNGAITANNLVNNSNGGKGALLDNCGYNGTVCTKSTIAAVTLTGSNQFKFNGQAGLMVRTNGAITLSNLTANNNSGGSGVFLDNCGFNDGTSACTSSIVSAVTLNGINTFNRNNSAGLSIFTNGPVTASNLSSTNNGWGDPTNGYGVDIENWTAAAAQPVTLTGSNYVSGNNLTNLWVYTKGAITISNLSSYNSNNGFGAYLDNMEYGSPTVTQGVTLTGSANFGSNWLDGLSIYSWGNISLANVNANNNGQGKDSSHGSGVFLDNCDYISGSGLCTATLPRTVTLTGNNNFNNNFTIWLGYI